jgi:hypothetical protein
MCVFRGCKVLTRVRVSDCEPCQTEANLRVCGVMSRRPYSTSPVARSIEEAEY